MLRGAMLAMLLVSAVADAGAQERAPTGTTADKPTTDSRLPMADRPIADKPTTDNRLPTADEPPPSAYDRARQDNGQAPETTSLVGQLIKTLVALSFVVAIIWVVFKVGLARLLPGAIGPRDGRLVRIVERVMVDQRSSLLIVDIGADRMLLGVAEGGISLISKLGPAQAPVDTARGGAPGFRAILEGLTPKKSSEDDNAGS